MLLRILIGTRRKHISKRTTSDWSLKNILPDILSEENLEDTTKVKSDSFRAQIKSHFLTDSITNPQRRIILWALNNSFFFHITNKAGISWLLTYLCLLIDCVFKKARNHFDKWALSEQIFDNLTCRWNYISTNVGSPSPVIISDI